MKSSIKKVFVIIGTIVGAGFVSGKEIFTFFFAYGKVGIVGMCLSCTLIGIVIYCVLKICEKNKIESFKEFCEIIENKIITKKDDKKIISNIFNIIINTFLLLMFFVMISGFSSFIYQEFYIPRIIGGLIIIILCYLTFMGNMKKIIEINNLLIPILIIFIIYVSEISKSEIQINYIESNTNRELIVKSILYASYNCIPLIPVIIQLYITEKNKKTKPLIVATISMGILLILSIAIFCLLSQANLEIYNLDMPIIAIAKKLGKHYGFLYSIVIGIAIYTSAISSGVRIFK